MIKGFREFILRGNVIDLAVAVVIGAAFTGVVNAIVTAIFNPLIGAIFNAKNLSHVAVVTVGNARIEFGVVLAAIIQFLIVAVVVYFVFVFPLNLFKERAAKRKAAGAPEDPVTVSEIDLLTDIRDLLALSEGAQTPRSGGAHSAVDPTPDGGPKPA